MEEIQGNITDEQWEKFKDDYNSNAGVHMVASENFADDVECLFDESESESESESEDESEDESDDETQHCDICMEDFHEDDLSCLCFNEKCGLFQKNCCKECCAKNKCEDCEDEDKCPACGKFMDNFDEDQCEAGCPLYDRGWEDR